MKNSLLILCLALFGMNGTAQTVQRANDWENLKVFAIHKEDPRVSFKVFADEQSALQNDYSQLPWYMGYGYTAAQYLRVEIGTYKDGVWKVSSVINGDISRGLSLPANGAMIKVKLTRY